MSNKLYLKQKIYPNQKTAAKEIFDSIKFELTTRKTCNYRAFLISAQMQSGKTGVLAQLFKDCYEKLSTKQQLDMWVISGVNATDLRTQTQLCMPTYDKRTLKSPVEVRNNANIKDLHDPEWFEKGVKNAIIVLDECHVGNQLESVVDRLFIELGVSWQDGHREVLSQLRKRNIFLVLVSATPYNAVYSPALNKVPPTLKLVTLKPGAGYYGLKQMLAEGKIRESEKVYQDDQISSKLLDLVSDVVTKRKQKYMLIRAHGCSEEVTSSLQRKFGKHLDIIEFNMNSKGSFSREQLSQKPAKATAVIVKNFWRVGNVLDTRHIAFMWDTPSSSVDTVAQSFAGRACGYGKKGNGAVIYTNLAAVEQFVKVATGEAPDANFKMSQNTKVSKKARMIGKPLVSFEVALKSTSFRSLSDREQLEEIRRHLEAVPNPLLRRLRKQSGRLYVRSAEKNATRNFKQNFQKELPTAGLQNDGRIREHCIWYEQLGSTKLRLWVVQLDEAKLNLNAPNIRQTENIFNRSA